MCYPVCGNREEKVSELCVSRSSQCSTTGVTKAMVCVIMSVEIVVRRLVSCVCVTGPRLTISFQPVLHDWCNKGRGMYYPVCGMVHVK